MPDILDDILRVGAATERDAKPQVLVATCARASSRVGCREPDRRPRVVCLEWFEPLYIAGHWVPEMVALAGGHDVIGRAGEPSVKIEWQDIVEAKPEVILLMPCGFDSRRTVKESTPLRSPARLERSARRGSENVFALNGNAYFSRPGPRLVNGLEILARIIHPETVHWSLGPTDASRFN